MAIVPNKSRPVPTVMRNVQYDDTVEPDIHLSTVNTDKLALFQFNLAQRTTDDRGNPDTETVFSNPVSSNLVAVTHGGDSLTHNGEVVTHA